MALVYVPHKPGNTHEYDSAASFGKITVVLEGAVSTHNHGMVEKMLKAGLSDFKPDDYLMLSGSRFILAVSLAIVLGRHGKVNVLQHSSRTNTYDMYVLDLGLGKG